MMKFFLVFLIGILLLFNLNAQQKAKFACSFFGTDVGSSIMNGQGLSFSSNNQAVKVVDNILSPTGLKRNFIVQESNKVANACAVVHGEQRYILYNNEFMKMVENSTKTDWSSISIMAHEIGHHLNGHTIQAGGSRPDIELEADEFSGFVLYKMGASLQDAQKAISTLVSEEGSSTHPGKFQRLQAIQKGWAKASGQGSSNSAPNTSVKTNENTSSNNSIKLEENIDFRTNIKSTINGLFHKWDDRWSVDRYIDGSNTLSSVIKEGQDYKITGSFRVNRSMIFVSQVVTVSYTARFSASGVTSYEVLSLCYTDGSSGQSDCY
jgi:hypothetical protein